MKRITLLALTLALLTACEDDPESTSHEDTTSAEDTASDTLPQDVIRIDLGGGEDTSEATDTTTATDTSTSDIDTSACDIIGFEELQSRSNRSPDKIFYLGVGTDSDPADWLTIELFELPSAPTTLELADSESELNYGTCTNCVTILSECEASSCRRAFFTTSGSLTIDSTGDVGDTFSGHLTDVVLEEVFISGGRSEPIPNGETWCLPRYEFSAVLGAP